MLTHNDIPVLVDFGFAQKWDLTAFKTSHHALAELSGQAIGNVPFMSRISWGTPEYLEPPVSPLPMASAQKLIRYSQRARGDWHDERFSDVWSLGVSPPYASSMALTSRSW